MLDINECYQELQELIEEAGSQVKELRDLEESINPETINILFRCMHTMKGIAGFACYEEFEKLSHDLEQILEYVKAELTLNEETLELLSEGLLVLERLLEDGAHHGGAQNTTLQSQKNLSERVLFYLNSLSSSAVETSCSDETEFRLEISEDLADSSSHPHFYLLHFSEATPTRSEKVLSELQQLGCFHGFKKGGGTVSYLYQSRIDETCISLFEIEAKGITREEYANLILTFQESDDSEENVIQPGEESSQKDRSEQTGSENLKESVNKKKNSKMVRISEGLLEKLMNLSSELVLLRNQQLIRLDEVSTSFSSTVHELDHLTSEIQELVMKTRLQPVSALLKKLERNIYGLAAKLGKKVSVQLDGLDVEMDRGILDKISEPLTHLVRNSCDHGIEDPDTRLETGKEETGVLRLIAWQSSSKIHLRIQDDGAGIDPLRVSTLALEKGLISQSQLDTLSDQEKLKLIFLPGFSTKETVSNTSGRGVGMDVVHSVIAELAGKVKLESIPGEGSVIDLELPASVSVLQTLIVEECQELFCIPQFNVKEVLQLYQDENNYKLDEFDNMELLHYRGVILPLLHLREVIQFLPRKERVRHKLADEGSLKILILQIGSNLFGLVIDQVIGTEEIVAKSIHSVLKSMRYYQGATVMGSGKVALILNLEEIRKIHIHDDRSTESSLSTRSTEFEHKQDYIGFENLDSGRFALPLGAVKKIIELSQDRFEANGIGGVVHDQDQFHQSSFPCLKFLDSQNYLLQEFQEKFRELISSHKVFAIILNDEFFPKSILAFGEIHQFEMTDSQVQRETEYQGSYTLIEWEEKLVRLIHLENFRSQALRFQNQVLHSLHEKEEGFSASPSS